MHAKIENTNISKKDESQKPINSKQPLPQLK